MRRGVPGGAAKLGWKLCTKEGPIVYPKQVLPDETKWGPEMWNENYRDDNPSANCYDTGTAPCKSNCPAHIAVQVYIRMAAEGRYMDALKLIKKENPFPAVCGHICNRRCEQACTRGSVDRARCHRRDQEIHRGAGAARRQALCAEDAQPAQHPVHGEGRRDPRCTFTEEQVKKEASRCLGCGVSVVDTNRCIGCGVCTSRCEFDAIHLAAITRKRPR